MRFAQIPLARLMKAKPVIAFAENVPDAAALALTAYSNFQPIYINRTTGRVLNPVWRDALAAQSNPPESLPCALLELSEQDEIGVAIVLNGGIEGLLYNVPTDTTRLMPYLSHLMQAERATLLALLPDPDYWRDFFDGKPDAPQLAAAIKPEDLNIPSLDLAMQAESAPTELIGWNSQSRRRKVAAYHFYVDDFRFSALAKKPDTLPDGVQVAIEPNFSTHDAQAGAAAIFDIWQKRMMSCVWQRRGVRIIVDMNVERRFLRLNLEGVPMGWRAYANRAYTDDLEHLFIAHEFARAHAGTDDILYIVYGGPRSREVCQRYGWHWLDAGKTINGKGYGHGTPQTAS